MRLTSWALLLAGGLMLAPAEASANGLHVVDEAAAGAGWWRTAGGAGGVYLGGGGSVREWAVRVRGPRVRRDSGAALRIRRRPSSIGRMELRERRNTPSTIRSRRCSSPCMPRGMSPAYWSRSTSARVTRGRGGGGPQPVLGGSRRSLRNPSPREPWCLRAREGSRWRWLGLAQSQSPRILVLAACGPVRVLGGAGWVLRNPSPRESGGRWRRVPVGSGPHVRGAGRRGSFLPW